jgi:hypothetical protein
MMCVNQSQDVVCESLSTTPTCFDLKILLVSNLQHVRAIDNPLEHSIWHDQSGALFSSDGKVQTSLWSASLEIR